MTSQAPLLTRTTKRKTNKNKRLSGQCSSPSFFAMAPAMSLDFWLLQNSSGPKHKKTLRSSPWWKWFWGYFKARAELVFASVQEDAALRHKTCSFPRRQGAIVACQFNCGKCRRGKLSCLVTFTAAGRRRSRWKSVGVDEAPKALHGCLCCH